MRDDWVVLRLPPDLLMSLRALAREAQVTPGQFIRNYVERSASSRPMPETIPRPAGPGVAMLRELVSDILFSASDWESVQRALVAEGFALRVKGLGLMLHAWPSDEPICKSAELGFAYSDMISRLGAGEPPDPVAEASPPRPRRLEAAS